MNFDEPTTPQIAPVVFGKECSACFDTKAEDDFPIKRGGRSTKCKQCTREYSKQHYEANRATRLPVLKAQKVAKRSELRAKVAAIRPLCACGKVAYSSLSATGGASLFIANSNATAINKLLSDPSSVHLCRSCAGRVSGRLGVGASHAKGAPTLNAAIVAAVALGASKAADIHKVVVQARPSSTLNSVRMAVQQLCALGELERVPNVRGSYIVAD